MEGELFVAQLTVLLEQPAAQRRLRRQPSSSRLPETAPAQVIRYQPDQRRMPIQPLRHRLQLTADLVAGKDIE